MDDRGLGARVPHTAACRLRGLLPPWPGLAGGARRGATQDQGTRPSSFHSLRVARPVLSSLTPGQGADHPVPTELALEDLCAEEAESEELEETWTSLLVFIVLFLLSMSYGAAVSLCKVGTDAPLPGGAPRQGSPGLAQSPPHMCPPQVKWVLTAVLQGQPQVSRDYTNITQRPLPPGV